MNVIVRNGWLETRDIDGNRKAVRIGAIEAVREITEGEPGVELLLTSHSFGIDGYYHEIVAARVPQESVAFG